MEAIRKQASKLREQVAKQQQAILKQLGNLSNEAVVVDEAEVLCHQQLQNLYKSTRAAKHFQRDIVHGVEGFISISSKKMDIAKRLAEDCCRYGKENESDGSPLARAAIHFGTSQNSMEEERKILLGVLSDQVSEPLREMIKGAPLEDARLLTHRYERFRHEVEGQAAEVVRRKSKSRDTDTSAEVSSKIQNSESKLIELKSTMMALGREATAAMLSVEAQQQRITFQRLRKMVDAERSYHQSIISILEKLHAEMIQQKQLNESSSKSVTVQRDANVPLPPAREDRNSNGSVDHGRADQSDAYFIARVIHPFDAQADGEVSLSVDDYVVVRQVASNGWSEGECKGKPGWFPSAYIERQDKAPTSKLSEELTSP